MALCVVVEVSITPLDSEVRATGHGLFETQPLIERVEAVLFSEFGHRVREVRLQQTFETVETEAP